MTNPIVLAIETATHLCDVAVGSAGQVLAQKSLQEPRAHARNLATMIADCIAEAGLQKTDLGAIAVSAGPGSYTGLRIGASTAKGLAYALGLPLLGISTLEAMVHPALAEAEAGDLLIPILPSRRGEVYTTLFEVTPSKDAQERVQPMAVEFEVAAEAMEMHLKGRAWIGGSDAAEALAELLPEDADVIQQVAIRPSAAAILALACKRLAASPEVDDDAALFEPAYLKDFIAKKPKGSAFDRLPF